MGARHQWLMPIILTNWYVEIKKITVPGQPGQIVLKTPFSKIPERNGLEVWLKP
jgi:hypothetical protein